MNTENIKNCIKRMDEGGGPQYERLAGKASHELRALEARVRELEEAAAPFAERPHDGMQNYPCHAGIFDDPERCGRCGRAIRLWNALANSEQEG